MAEDEIRSIMRHPTNMAGLLISSLEIPAPLTKIHFQPRLLDGFPLLLVLDLLRAMALLIKDTMVKTKDTTVKARDTMVRTKDIMVLQDTSLKTVVVEVEVEAVTRTEDIVGTHIEAAIVGDK